MKLRKLKKAQAKASRDAEQWAGGVPVMDVPVPGAPTGTVAFAEALHTGSEPGEPVDEDSLAADAAASADAATPADAAAETNAAAELDAAAQADAERIALAETMYRAAHARFEAAEAREQAAGERLQAAEAAEEAAAERLAATERGEQAIAERLAEAEAGDRAIAERLAEAEAGERAIAERLAEAEAGERAVAERLAAAEARERAAADRLAAAEARERAAAERDAIANQRDRTAAERDAIALERDRLAVERGGRPDARTPAATGSGREAGRELEIARLEAELERAHLDSLTGALRREIGRLTLHNEIERARRSDGRFVLAFVDVDDLKGINDREGHAAGDRVLRTLAASLRANLRTYDPVVRYGGDEFVCGVTGVSAGELEHRMTLIDQSLRRSTGVGISAGMATLIEGESLDEITARADAALLEVKRNRDR